EKTKKRVKIVGELKCPYGERDPTVYDDIKYYYYPQCQFHLKTHPELEFCLFAPWSPRITRAWKIYRDPTFWEMALPLFVFFVETGRRRTPPQAESDSSRSKQVMQWCKNAEGEFVGEWTSTYSKYSFEEMIPLFAKR